jgi:dihydrofolate reductase
MTPRSVGLIWAQTRDGVIGANGAIPWHIPEDLAHFKEITLGHPVVMGRKTWDSLPEKYRPLTGRRNIVVTRNPDWSGDGAERAPSLEDALKMTDPDEAWVIGGAEIYRLAMPYATEIAVTLVETDVPGDRVAPAIDPERFLLAYTTGPTRSANGRDDYLFRGYARKPRP